MDDLGGGGLDTGVNWGTAERAAIDRCLSVPGLAERKLHQVLPRRLTRTIETEIIPRLMLAHSTGRDEPTDQYPELTPADVADFATTVLAGNLDSALVHIETVRARGHSLETVLLHLLGPTARLLGDMWAQDLCSFAEVTIGVSRLQQVLRELSPRFENEITPGRRGHILLAAMPGEQHSFGVSILESFFRRAGWDVSGGTALSRKDLLALANDEWLDAIGLSLSCDVLFEHIRPTIQALRKASRNPSVFVFVGGRYFLDHPQRAAEAGADAAASDAPDALRQADSCLSFALARC